LVIATGGLSFPKLGATGFGHHIASQFGLKLIDIRPGLVPLMFGHDEKDYLRDLSGISVAVIARHHGKEFRENMLVTHHGFSGPAILQISSYWREGETIDIDLLPNLDAGEWLFEHHRQRIELHNLLRHHLPQRFADAWCRRHAESKPVQRFKAAELREIGRALNHWRVSFPANEGYAKAEVTLGGVDTRGLSSKTMEARGVRGLYFIGEVVDVTGWLGGYNFQWAWSSGFAAGHSV
jgi:predicted Rossmann fold flavoprotein